MTEIRNQIRFLLNSDTIVLDKISPTLTLLDYLRLKRRLCGTKEGCAEGDCGACTVLVGRIKNNDLIYESVNACIRFVGTLDGCHVITVEHLKRQDGTLHPVQQAMVDHHGSQCGFCTPGFVMSLYALWITNPNPTNTDVEIALQGNLCRCTGYEPIVKAAKAISSIDVPENDPLKQERQEILGQLNAMQDGARVEIRDGEDLLILPSSLDDLADVRQSYPNSTIVAGSTDVGLWVTKQMRDLSPVISISHLEELNKINVTETGVTIGACVSYTEMLPVIEEYFPDIARYWRRIGGEQVRNMGTIGGNIANGSPIGDTPPLLIALGASMTLRQGNEQRIIPVEDFFIDYGKQDRLKGDFVETIQIPFPKDKDLFAAYKISKRRDEDISAVATAFKLRIADGIIQSAILAYGGMAATPKRATHAEEKLVGKPWTEENLVAASSGLDDDFAPLSDWRASAEYRNLIAKNLLRRFYLETVERPANSRLDREAIVEMMA